MNDFANGGGAPSGTGLLVTGLPGYAPVLAYSHQYFLLAGRDESDFSGNWTIY